MIIKLSDKAFKDLSYWSKSDPRFLNKIFELLSSIQKEPFSGLGKPEPLKYELKGYWSRRINEEHRIVYKIENNEILIISCRYHYSQE